MSKSEEFDDKLQELARLGKAMSHPARPGILGNLAETRIYMSGDISDNVLLSRTTVSQYLKELREEGLIHGTIVG